MSFHYYCWALGYSSDGEMDPILRTLCDDVSRNINKELIINNKWKIQGTTVAISLVSQMQTITMKPNQT